MANLRPPHPSLQGMSQAGPLGRRLSRRWPLIAGAALALLLVLAWIEGGEEPVHPIAEPVSLPEQQP